MKKSKELLNSIEINVLIASNSILPSYETLIDYCDLIMRDMDMQYIKLLYHEDDPSAAMIRLYAKEKNMAIDREIDKLHSILNADIALVFNDVSKPLTPILKACKKFDITTRVKNFHG